MARGNKEIENLKAELDEEEDHSPHHPRPRGQPAVKAPDVIVSSLGVDTLRWIRTRRSKDSSAKVAMSYSDQKQLRDLFDGFDFDKTGTVDLNELRSAIDYVRAIPQYRRMASNLDHLEMTFIAMDVDGDATVDFLEFCDGMTSGKGPFIGLTHTDVEKILSKFAEYAVVSKRNRAITEINAADTGGSDLPKYLLFKSLFDVKSTLFVGEKKASAANSFNEDTDPEKAELLNRVEEEKRFMKSLVPRRQSPRSPSSGKPSRAVPSIRSRQSSASSSSSNSFIATDDSFRTTVQIRRRAVSEAYAIMRERHEEK